MKIYLEQAVFCNVAPFGDLTLNFNENEIAVLTAVNGKGKTTILSYIADAFHEAAKIAYSNSFEGKENKYYRLSSNLAALDMGKPFAVYLFFRVTDVNGTASDPMIFIELRGAWTGPEIAEKFKGITTPAYQIVQTLEANNNIYKTIQADKEITTQTFASNVVTYFPSYRYEEPNYLNDPYKITPHFKVSNEFSGYLKNPIEVISGLPELANWLLDVTLDLQLTSAFKLLVHNAEGKPLVQNIGVNIFPPMSIIEEILSATLSGKFANHQIGLQIGKRSSGMIRLQVIDRTESRFLYPSIFQISSGEAALLCIFAEILRQADNNHEDIELEKITGIVLIDEVDKHLHIKMQKEVLPQLFNLFPNVQFVVSSHSPFLSMGLAETCPERSRLINLDQDGLSQEPIQNELYTEVYEMMVSENERFKENFEILKTRVTQLSRPLIITEGKTDVIHLQTAKEKLGISGDFDFFDVPENWGQDFLNKHLEALALIGSPKKVIGVFDRDVKKRVQSIEENGQAYKKYGEDVYGICIPKIHETEYGEHISIEHYYPKGLLLKGNSEGRRLFLAREFMVSGKSEVTDNAFETSLPEGQLKHKLEVNGVIDEKVYLESDRQQNSSIALSKNDFAQLIKSDFDFVGGFDFETFRPIFDKISGIISES